MSVFLRLWATVPFARQQLRLFVASPAQSRLRSLPNKDSGLQISVLKKDVNNGMAKDVPLQKEWYHFSMKYKVMKKIFPVQSGSNAGGLYRWVMMHAVFVLIS